jgi:hypothetical protein
MKIFIYKFTIILIGLFLLFQFTIGSQVKKIEQEIYNLSSKQKIFDLKEKIRKELKDAASKDRILSKEDANLLRDFINKIDTELNE